MSKWDKYEVKSSANSYEPTQSRWDQYEVKSAPKEDKILPLIGKSAAKGVEGVLNLPNVAARGAEWASRLAKKIVNSPTFDVNTGKETRGQANLDVPTINFGKHRPSPYGSILKKHLDIGEPEAGDDPWKKILSVGTEYATPAGFLGALGKGARLKGALDSAKGAAKLGAGVAGAEELGISPLVTETAALSRGKVSDATKRVASKLMPALTQKQKISVAEKKVAKLLQNYGTMGKGDLSNITKFDDKAKRLYTPTTAEVAQNTGISHLHNATTGIMPSVGEKMMSNDSILNRELQKIGKDLKLEPNHMSMIARNQIEQNLTRATGRRAKETAPLYKKLEEDTTRIKPKQFNESVDKSSNKQIGEIRTRLERLKTTLPEAQKHLIAPLEKRLDGLGKDKLIHLAPEYRDLNAKIAHIKETATPSQIDKMITNIGEKIAKLKKEPTANGTLIKYYTEGKKALEADLVTTASGRAARAKYQELSVDVNKINRDKLLKKFTDKDQFGTYKVAEDKLLDSVLAAPLASVKAYSNQIKGTKAERATSAFVRDKYLGAASEGLPSYHKSRQWLQNYGTKAKELLTPEDYKRIVDNQKYLKNRNNVQTANKTINSITAEKRHVLENVAKHLGKEYDGSILSKALAYGSSKVPLVGKPIASTIADQTTKRNVAYSVLEDAMTNPATAKRLLQSLKPADAKKVRNLLPAVILNELGNV